MKRTRRSRLSTLIFLLPILVVVAVAAYQVLSYSSTQDGVLKVYAIDTRNDNITGVSASINGMSVQLPYAGVLAQGDYTVTYSSVKWFITPSPKHVTVLGGRTAYAIGVYTPKPVNVAITQAGFNVSSVTVLHIITPLVITNTQSDYAVLTGLPGRGNVVLAPGQSFTASFNETGTFKVQVLYTRFVLNVDSV
jgi:hypothetical protein